MRVVRERFDEDGQIERVTYFDLEHARCPRCGWDMLIPAVRRGIEVSVDCKCGAQNKWTHKGVSSSSHVQ